MSDYNINNVLDFLDNYNIFEESSIKNSEIEIAKKIIKDRHICGLNINKDGVVAGPFYNECCCVNFLKETNKYMVDRSGVKMSYFEEMDNDFNLKIPNIKGFKCYGKSLKKDRKCIYETCPYIIALRAINVVWEMDYNDSVENLNNYIVNKNDSIENIDKSLSEIKDNSIKKELELIKKRFNLLNSNDTCKLTPTIYLVLGDNKNLKKTIINVLSKIILNSNDKLNTVKKDMLSGNLCEFKDCLTIIKNLDKIYSETDTQQKEHFYTNLYKMEESYGYIIIDTSTDIGVDIISNLNKNSVDINFLRLDILDYNEDELSYLFFEDIKKLGFSIDSSVEELFKKGYMKKYMSFYSNLKNTQLINNLKITVCDNYSKIDNAKPVITYDLFPDVLDRMAEKKSVEEKLNNLIGLHSVKKQLTDLIHYLNFLKKVDNKINMPVLNLHSVFSGNPGTGKTTIARIYADMLYSLGYIKENKLIEVSRDHLIAEYVGQTAIKTKKVFDKAMGGVLFIDEAYSLIPTGGSGFENECISTIIKIMEDRRNDIVVIFAGYKDDMKKFLKTNEGLSSRVNNHLLFDDYSTEELYKILDISFSKMNLKLDTSAKPKIMNIIKDAKKESGFGNGRYIMNLRQNALMKHSINTANIESEIDLLTIVEADFN